MARAFCASMARGVSTSACTVIIRSASSSTNSTIIGNWPSPYVSSHAASGGESGASRATVERVGRAPGGFLSGFPSRTFKLNSAKLRALLAFSRA